MSARADAPGQDGTSKPSGPTSPKAAPKTAPAKGPRLRKDGQPDKRYGGGNRKPVAPGLVPRRKGQHLKITDERRRTPNLHPIQIRALDAYFDPKNSTIDDVAKDVGVSPRTVRHWLATHPKFIEEWRRRTALVVDGFAGHTIRAAIAAMNVLVKIAQDESQDVRVRMDAADKILRATHGLKVQIDVAATHQHAHVVAHVPAPATSDGSAPPPASVRRLTTGTPTVKDWQTEIRELAVTVEQIGAGALTTLEDLERSGADMATQDVIDGEATLR